MCCFSQPVRSVHSTNIFARPAEERRQFLVYSMTLDARKELAMILPFPVKTPAAENDVEFIDLHFDHSLFCQPTPEQRPAIEEWQESYTHPTRFMRMEQTRRIVLPDQHCYKREMHGSLPNRDTFLEIQV